MKYPRMPIKYDRRYKIKPNERKKVKKLKKEGFSISKIAKKFDVSITTIRHILFPKEKQLALERCRRRNSFLWATDEKFREKMRKWCSEKTKYKKKVVPLTKRYYAGLMKPIYWKKGNKKKWQKIKNNPKLLKEYHQKCKEWENKVGRDYINQKARKNYKKRLATNIIKKVMGI